MLEQRKRTMAVMSEVIPIRDRKTVMTKGAKPVDSSLPVVVRARHAVPLLKDRRVLRMLSAIGCVFGYWAEQGRLVEDLDAVAYQDDLGVGGVEVAAGSEQDIVGG